MMLSVWNFLIYVIGSLMVQFMRFFEFFDMQYIVIPLIIIGAVYGLLIAPLVHHINYTRSYEESMRVKENYRKRHNSSRKGSD